MFPAKKKKKANSTYVLSTDLRNKNTNTIWSGGRSVAAAAAAAVVVAAAAGAGTTAYGLGLPLFLLELNYSRLRCITYYEWPGSLQLYPLLFSALPSPGDHHCGRSGLSPGSHCPLCYFSNRYQGQEKETLLTIRELLNHS